MDATMEGRPLAAADHGRLMAAGETALQRWFGQPLADWSACGVAPVPLLRVEAGATLVHEGAPARSLYLVQAGEFKVVRTDEDGYEQVLDFANRFDALGFDGMASGQHASGAVALEDAAVYAIPLADVDQLRRRLPAFAEQLHATFCRQLARLSEMAWLMAAVGADRRTARFLLQQSRRMSAMGQSPLRLHLRMSRRDIAGHLGLAHESISRSLGVLAAAGVVRVRNRDVDILDLATLESFARGGRPASGESKGGSDESPRRRAMQRPPRSPGWPMETAGNA